MLSHYGFNLHFLTNIDHLFMSLLAVCIILWHDCSCLLHILKDTCSINIFSKSVAESLKCLYPFFLYVQCFWGPSQESFAQLKSTKMFSYVFQKLYSFSFVFKSVVHLEIILVYGVRQGLQFPLFILIFQLFQHHLLKRFLFPIVLVPLQKII